MRRINVPISDEDIRSLKVGDTVHLNGVIMTGRDAAHKFMIEHFIKNEVQPDEAALYQKLQEVLDGGVIYHCGPVVKTHEDGSYSFVAAGPAFTCEGASGATWRCSSVSSIHAGNTP